MNTNILRHQNNIFVCVFALVCTSNCVIFRNWTSPFLFIFFQHCLARRTTSSLEIELLLSFCFLSTLGCTSNRFIFRNWTSHFLFVFFQHWFTRWTPSSLEIELLPFCFLACFTLHVQIYFELAEITHLTFSNTTFWPSQNIN